VESGHAGPGPSDGAQLAEAAGCEPQGVVGLTLPEPLAPVVAARRAGVRLDLTLLESLRPSGHLLVEGAGGALVELAAGWTAADLASRWGLPVVVVAGNRLGVLNHSLLTVEALVRRGVQVLAVVLNTVHSGAASVAEQENPDELRRLLPGLPVLGPVPWLANPRDPDALRAVALGPLGPLLSSIS
jgi:dethiobiotin synthetase